MTKKYLEHNNKILGDYLKSTEDYPVKTYIYLSEFDIPKYIAKKNLIKKERIDTRRLLVARNFSKA